MKELELECGGFYFENRELKLNRKEKIVGGECELAGITVALGAMEMSKMKFGAPVLLSLAGLLAWGGAADAADLGGNCCADLEERIAELEATTARKGNRKVSLTVSGWIGQQVMWWDDGSESNAYVHDLGSGIASNVKFTGEATITQGWTAGYVLHLETIGSDSLSTNQDRADGFNVVSQTSGSNGVSALQSYWFIKSDQLGKLSVGKQHTASTHAAIFIDGSGSALFANWVAYDVNSFGIRMKNGAFVGPTGPVRTASESALIWGGGRYCQSAGGALGDCDGFPRNVVRYDSPTFAGFSGSASWGEDDIWSLAGRYAGEWADFKITATAAYFESTDENLNLGVSATQQYFQAAAYLQHIPTGLFAYGAYGHDSYDSAPGQSEAYHLKGGIRRSWNTLGHSVLYGEFLHVHGTGEFSQSAQIANNFDATENTTKLWGIGVVQEIDAAAMSIWLKYRHLDYADDNQVGVSYKGFQYVGVGAMISY